MRRSTYRSRHRAQDRPHGEHQATAVPWRPPESPPFWRAGPQPREWPELLAATRQAGGSHWEPWPPANGAARAAGSGNRGRVRPGPERGPTAMRVPRPARLTP
ncbi:hypothetical protein SSPO_100140 [Streptomyces antimycoticus]|uniref:Uncharacterized protein n=1 Tax=Streptomyces antimycoticus TaxID=68175 RepID=A0A499VGI5_9ACTN|nr:hypothetical protein SSPO_100140 [Streptomyces antimycoticus]